MAVGDDNDDWQGSSLNGWMWEGPYYPRLEENYDEFDPEVQCDDRRTAVELYLSIRTCLVRRRN